jgi:hypothetical protein
MINDVLNENETREYVYCKNEDEQTMRVAYTVTVSVQHEFTAY